MPISHSNLCLLAAIEQQAIETDKSRWFIAYKMVRNKPIHLIKDYIESISDQEEREDMRLKLNESYKDRFI